MKTNQPRETIQPIDDEITRQTWFHIKRDVDHLQAELARRANQTAIIGRPQPEQAKQLQHSIFTLICAIGETIGKINQANTNREINERLEPSRERDEHENQPQHNNTKHVHDPPSTDNLDRLHKELTRQTTTP